MPCYATLALHVLWTFCSVSLCSLCVRRQIATDSMHLSEWSFFGIVQVQLHPAWAAVQTRTIRAIYLGLLLVCFLLDANEIHDVLKCAQQCSYCPWISPKGRDAELDSLLAAYINRIDPDVVSCIISAVCYKFGWQRGTYRTRLLMLKCNLIYGCRNSRKIMVLAYFSAIFIGKSLSGLITCTHRSLL